MVAGIDDSIARLTPVSDLEYQEIETALRQAYPKWHAYLIAAQQELEIAMTEQQFRLLARAAKDEVLNGTRHQFQSEVIVTARLKSIQAIVDKMRRFGEPLMNMLDIWGFRIIVSDAESLEKVLPSLTGLWPAPTDEEMTLRHGTLKFDWLRDYRARNHAGLSNATSVRYDEAIHVNRRPPFGVVEIQILTVDLYRRAYTGTGEEAHVNFVRRRRAAEARQQNDKRSE